MYAGLYYGTFLTNRFEHRLDGKALLWEIHPS